MLDDLRDTAVTQALAADAIGGCGFAEASTKYYTDLPDSLPALCVGPIAAVPGTFERSRGESADAGRLWFRADVSLLVLSPYQATGDATEFGGADGASLVAERLVSSFARNGWDPVRLVQAEGEHGGRPVYSTQAVFRVSTELSWTAL